MVSNSLAERGSKLDARRYDEEFADEDIIELGMFSVDDKLVSERFESPVGTFVQEMKGEEVTLKYFQENGFVRPILVKNKAGLGIRLPDKRLTLDDIKQHVGSDLWLDVVDTRTQKHTEMTMKEWCAYYEDVPRDRLLNVVSLEFSHTQLDSLIESPNIVRQMDWVDWVWPKHLKNIQTESTNSTARKYPKYPKYPKVQKYCLMSVKSCFTNFKINCGGASVWYHILQGQQVLWLIPPTEKNIQLYEQWVLSGKQNDIFFGDTVEHCARVCLHEANTFFIPSGWIYAMYASEDSLAFGGNLLHSFGIEIQLRIAQVEDVTQIPSKFRYPFFNEMLWYVLERYVHCLTGKTHQSCNEDGSPVIGGQKGQKNSLLTLMGPKRPRIHLTPFEISGLMAIIIWLSELSSSEKAVPELILTPEALLSDAKNLLDDHATDDHVQSCTGQPVLFWKSQMRIPNSAPPKSLTAQLREKMKGNLFSNKQSKANSSKSTNDNANQNEWPPMSLVESKYDLSQELWKRQKAGRLQIVHIDQYGKLISELEPEPDKPVASGLSKAMTKLMSKSSDEKAQEAKAWLAAEMIVNDICKITSEDWS